jgi:hypothetical protein
MCFLLSKQLAMDARVLVSIPEMLSLYLELIYQVRINFSSNPLPLSRFNDNKITIPTYTYFLGVVLSRTTNISPGPEPINTVKN